MAATARGPSAIGEAGRLTLVLWASLAAVSELFRHGLPFATQDTPIHLYRLLDFSTLFEAGQIFPRLAPNLGLGYGYATFTFYPPAAVYLGEGFHLLGLGYIASLKASFALGILLGGLGMYLLARELFGPGGATIAAIAYAYVPYRLLTVYVRGDAAECLAQGVLPLAAWAVLRVCDRPTAGRIAFGGVALAALVESHALTTLLAVPFLAGVVVLRLARSSAGTPANASATAARFSRLSPTHWTVAAIAGTGLLGAAISATYWLPVLLGTRDLNAAALVEGFFDYHKWFIPFDQLIQPRWLYDYQVIYEQGLRFNVGRVQALLFALSVLWVIVARPKARSILLFCAVLGLFLIWMEQDGSTAVWDRLAVLRYVQFPHRLSGPLGVVTVLLIGSLWSARTPWLGRGLAIVGPLLAVVSLTAFVYTSLHQLPRRHEVLQEAEVNVPALWRIEVAHQRIAGMTQGDYLPETSRGDMFNLTTASVPIGTGMSVARVTATSVQPFDLVATTSGEVASTITLDRFAYAGWLASIDGQDVPTRPQGPLGLVAVDVPAGNHQLSVWYGGASGDAAAIALTGAGLACAAVLAVAPGRRRFLWRAGWIALPVVLVVAALVTRFDPPRQFGASGNFGDAFRLVGASLSPPAAASGVVELNLLWEGLAATSAECDVRVRLLDDTGKVVARRDKAPLFGLRPCSGWQPGEIAHDLEEIRLPPDIPGGAYRLAVGFVDGNADVAPDGSSPVVTWVDSDVTGAVTRSGFDLGTVNVPSGPSERALDGGTAVGATVGRSFQIVEARVQPSPLPTDPVLADRRFIARLSPADRLSVDLGWRALGDTNADFSVFAQLLDHRAQLVAQDDGWPDSWYSPTSTWFPGDMLVDHRTLVPRGPLAPGLYHVVVGLYDPLTMARQPVEGPGADRDQVVLGTVKVSTADHVFGQPTVLPRRPAELGGEIKVIGAKLETDQLQPGDVARVDVGWQAMVQPTSADTVFLHLMSADGRLVGQHDGPPLGGAFPTSSWDAGDTLYDAIDLPLPTDLPAGAYNVVVGMYRPDTGARLAEADGSTEYAVGTVTVR